MNRVNSESGLCHGACERYGQGFNEFNGDLGEFNGDSDTWGILGCLPSGNDCYIANWKMAIEIVDFPMKHGDFPQLC